MKNSLLILFASICISLSFIGNTFSPQTQLINKDVIKRTTAVNQYFLYEKGQVILKFKDQINFTRGTSFGINALDNALQGASVKEISARFPVTSGNAAMIGISEMQKIYTVVYNADIDPYDYANQIFEANKNILEYACVNLVMETDYNPNDPNISQQYHIPKISSFGAWDITKGDTNVVIGVIDSGTDVDHPDLAANFKYNYADIPGNSIDDDANGYVDDFLGWDFGDGDNDPNCNNNHASNAQNCSHGSHVSGCATQVTDNGTGGAGIGFKCKYAISKHGKDNDFSGPGGVSFIYSSDIGFYYLTSRGVKVINCSFGSPATSGATINAITFAWGNGVVICASAGNDGANVFRYPASYENVVSVAASTSSDLKASFSNFHDTVDVIAPGENINSTLWNNNYANLSGTSMSSPVAAGTVALIKSKYPSWTNQQVVARLKLGVDSIYHLNPAYVGLLGTGRVNAFKCVSDLPIIALVSNSPSDSLFGNNDKVFDIDEVVAFNMFYKNVWVSGNNVSLRLTTADPDVQIVQDSVYAGNLSAYTTYSTSPSNTFRVKAKATCPFDKVVTFNLRTSNNAYSDVTSGTFTVTFRQGWATHTVNNMKLSLTKDGAVGKKTQAYGSGLNITGYPAGQQMLEGGLMIGISNTKVSDDCRRGSAPTNISDTDFTPLTSYQLQTPGIFSNQDGRGYFNDNGAGVNKIGVTVRSESFSWNSAPDANYIILRYTIKNTSGANISNMYAGVYMFYTPNNINTSNICALDTINKIGYSYNTGTSNPYLGVSILSGQNLNFKALGAAEVLTGFTTQEKWDAMSNGIVNGSTAPGSNCFVVSAGPINLNNGDSVVVGYAVVKGNDKADLIANSNTAKNRFNVIGVEQISSIVPEKFALYQNYPNPFNPVTTIKFDVARADVIKIKVYDIIGREVSYFSRELQPGGYKYEFDATNFASGIYFYRLESQYYSDVKKMILIK